MHNSSENHSRTCFLTVSVLRLKMTAVVSCSVRTVHNGISWLCLCYDRYEGRVSQFNRCVTTRQFRYTVVMVHEDEVVNPASWNWGASICVIVSPNACQIEEWVSSVWKAASIFLRECVEVVL